MERYVIETISNRRMEKKARFLVSMYAKGSRDKNIKNDLINLSEKLDGDDIRNLWDSLKMI